MADAQGVSKQGKAKSGRMSASGDPSKSMEAEEKVVYINPSSLASGGIAEKAAAIFRVYDANNKNALEHDSMMQALAELGVINGLTSKKLTEILSIGSESSVGKGRSYSLQEFVSFYERLAHYQAKAARQERIKALSKMPGIPDGAEGNELLKRVFLNYCKYTVGQTRSTYDEQDPKMSSTQYVKLCQDLGLVQPAGPLNVVTVDVIFHKCKPQGGRRLMYPHYLKALYAAAQESNMNVIELVEMLAQQIKPNSGSVFIAPQQLMFRQETRSMEQSKFKVPDEPVMLPPEEISSDDESAPAPRKPRAPKERVLELSDDEDDKKETSKSSAKGASSAQPTTLAPRGRSAFVDTPVRSEPATAGLYSMGQGGKNWQGELPDDAPTWVHQMAGKMNELEERNYELSQQLKQHSASRLANGSGVDFAALEAAGIDPKVILAAQAAGAVSGADMTNLLIDVDKRLKAMESGTGGRRGIKGVNRTGGDDDGDDDDDELFKRIDQLEKQLEEVRDGEKLKSEMKDDMKKLAKAAATAATKSIPNLEQRVATCESKEEALEQTTSAHAAKIATVEGRMKSLSDGLQAEVTRAIATEMSRNLGNEMTKLLEPGGDLGKVVTAKVEEVAGEMGDRLTTLEAHGSTSNAKVGALEGVLAEQAAKVEQALALAQEGMSRQVALAPKLSTLENSGQEWTKMASTLESAIKELQGQVKELQTKNSTLESEVEKLKSGAGKEGAAAGTESMLRQESLVRGEAGGRKGGEAIAVAELTGRMMGMEGTLKEVQAGLVTALTAVGFTPVEATKEGAMIQAANKHAAHEATLAEVQTRLDGVEHKQQEANVTLKKAEAMLSGGVSGLAAMNAASAAAASAANARKEKRVDEEVVADLASRISSVESRLKELSNSTSSAISAASAVPALEATINSKLPELESLIRQQDLAHKGLMAKLPDIDAFIATIRTRIPELDTALKVAETRVTELERKATNADRLVRELSDLIKAVQVEQEGMAANAAMNAQLRAQGGGGGHSGVDSGALQLVMATEERLQKHIQQLKEALNNQIGDLDAAKVKYDTNLDMVQATFEQLHLRLANMEGSSGNDSRISAYARVTELRDLENHFLDRLRLQADNGDKMQRTINQLVSDVERVVNSHNSSEQARVANANQRPAGSAMGMESLALVEQRIEARLAMLATQYVTIEALREWEIRFASTDALRVAVDKARANDEVVLAAVKEVDKQLHEKLEINQQVMLRMARQVDVLQNTIRTAPAPDGGTPQIKIIKGTGAGTPPLPSVSAIPASRPDSSSMDPLSILLAQANAASGGAPPPALS